MQWYICQGDMFRTSRSSSGPPRKQVQELFSFPALWDPTCLQLSVNRNVKYMSLYKLNLQAHILYVPVTETCKHLGSNNAGKLNNSWTCFLGGPEDDLLGRNMSPWHIYHCI